MHRFGRTVRSGFRPWFAGRPSAQKEQHTEGERTGGAAAPSADHGESGEKCTDDCRLPSFIDAVGLGGTFAVALQLLAGHRLLEDSKRRQAGVFSNPSPFGLISSAVLPSHSRSLSSPTLGTSLSSSASTASTFGHERLSLPIVPSLSSSAIANDGEHRSLVIPHAGSQFGSTASIPMASSTTTVFPTAASSFGASVSDGLAPPSALHPATVAEAPVATMENATQTPLEGKQGDASNRCLTSTEPVDFELARVLGRLHNAIGVDLKNRKLYAEAVEHFKQASELGHPAALFNLGQCYHRGFGVHKNLVKAQNFWESAAHKGHGLASYQLGVSYQRKNEVEKALAWMRRAADYNVPEATSFINSVKRLESQTT